MPEIQKIDRHLCFVCANSYSLFTDDNVKSIGGVETRSVFLAEMMSKYFRKVSFAIKNTKGKIINKRGLNVVRYEPAVISNTPNSGLAQINADIYITFESHYYSADVVRTCNIINKPVVHWATSFLDYDKSCTLDNYERFYFGWIGRESAYSFYLADYLISQTKDQQKMLYENHKLKSIVIRNPFINTKILSEHNDKLNYNPMILWIGRIDPVFKRPELLLKIAEQLPEYRFLMIMSKIGDDYNEYFDKIVLAKTDNVEIIEYVAPDKMNEIYRKSSILLSTSSKEGFPNIFLQAISHNVPVVSLEVDPDGIFSRHGCGICCNGDINRAVESIKFLLNNSQERNKIKQRAFKYVQVNHSSEVIAKQMVDFFSSISTKVKNSLKWTSYSFNRLYEQLQSNYKLLESNCNQLQSNYNQLQSNYNQLQSNYNQLDFTHKKMLSHRILRVLNKIYNYMDKNSRN